MVSLASFKKWLHALPDQTLFFKYLEFESLWNEAWIMKEGWTRLQKSFVIPPKASRSHFNYFCNGGFALACDFQNNGCWYLNLIQFITVCLRLSLINKFIFFLYILVVIIIIIIGVTSTSYNPWRALTVRFSLLNLVFINSCSNNFKTFSWLASKSRIWNSAVIRQSSLPRRR